MADDSIDAVVTDPPYGLSFMNKHWDHDVPSVELWREVLRVLKPGGHVLSFGGTRTYHRMVVNIEDAGFEIRDQIQWIYGSGFPKSHNLKDKWQGLGTALKPANEPIVLARKPLIGTVAENVQTFGTGALNIDASRIATTDNLNGGTYSGDRRPSSRHSFGSRVGSGALKNGIGKEYTQPHGRWPANVLFDESAAEFLDASLAENGINLHAPGNKNKTRIRNGKNVKFNGAIENVDASRFQLGGDPTKASRFFYVAKASKRERGEGNVHPTVKPIKLMEYLVKLVTPPNGTVFDPFMGSGTTGIAAKSLGFGFVGIERSEEYFEIAKRRI